MGLRGWWGWGDKCDSDTEGTVALQGVPGKRPACRDLPGSGGDVGVRFVPLEGVNKQRQKQNNPRPPTSPFSLRYAQLLGLEAMHSGRKERERERRGVGGGQQQRYTKIRALTAGVMSTGCAKVVLTR